MKFREYVIKRRKELNLTQLEIAKELGFKGAQAYANFENNYQPLAQKHLLKLTTVLREAPEVLFKLYLTSSSHKDMKPWLNTFPSPLFPEFRGLLFANANKHGGYLKKHYYTRIAPFVHP